jgi:hypothetical protein
VNESVPEPGVCAGSALVKTRSGLSADLSGISSRIGIPTGRRRRSAWLNVRLDLFFSGDWVGRAKELLRLSLGDFEMEGLRLNDKVGLDAVESKGSEFVVGEPLLVVGLEEVGVLLLNMLFPPLKRPLLLEEPPVVVRCMAVKACKVGFLFLLVPWFCTWCYNTNNDDKIMRFLFDKPSVDCSTTAQSCG